MKKTGTHKTTVKIASFLISASLLLVWWSVYGPRLNSAGFDYFSVDCSIYSKAGKIIFYSKEQLCAFADDGKLLTSDPNSNALQMTDRSGTVLWSSYENIHHDLKFTMDQKGFLAIATEVFEYNKRPVRSDCFSKRDLQNKVLTEWCLSRNLKQFESRGFTIRTQLADTFARNDLNAAEYEISHANTIYEIPKNRLSEKFEAFREGNYLVDLHSPSYALLILDKDMKSILWSKNLTQQVYGLNRLSFSAHDSQITPEGKILSYVNSHKTLNYSVLSNSVTANREAKRDFGWGSSLVEFDPVSESINWIFETEPNFRFRSFLLGSVTELRNKNYLFSDITYKIPAVYEVDRERRVIWKFEIPNTSSSKFGFRIRKVKPMYDPLFLKARGLIDYKLDPFSVDESN